MTQCGFHGVRGWRFVGVERRRNRVHMKSMDDPEFFEYELLPVPTDVAARAADEISGCEYCSEG